MSQRFHKNRLSFEISPLNHLATALSEPAAVRTNNVHANDMFVIGDFVPQLDSTMSHDNKASGDKRSIAKQGWVTDVDWGRKLGSLNIAKEGGVWAVNTGLEIDLENVIIQKEWKE